jgi:hypothetical protein
MSAESQKLHALQNAARIGFDAIERGEYRQFDNVGDLSDYLRRLSDEIIDAAASATGA